jgi:hypothetical protein
MDLAPTFRPPSPNQNQNGNGNGSDSSTSSTGTSLSGIAGDVGAGLGIWTDLQRGGTLNDARAGVTAGSLLTKGQGTYGDSTLGDVNGGLAALQEGYGIYSGLKQGGVKGDLTAGINAARLYGNLSSLSDAAGTGSFAGSAIGDLAGYAAVPLALYNFAENWQSGKTGSDAIQGAEAGATIGSVVPGIGTAIGAVAGAAIGAISSAFGPGAKDPEGATFDAYSAAYAKGGSQAVANATPSQTLQSLAGLFDLRSGQIGPNVPMYNQYGRMGEAKFSTDMLTQVNQAFKNGQITSADTPQSIYSKIVQPWINSWGKGDLSKDPHGAAISNMMTQMIGQYMSGQLTSATRVGVSGQTLPGLQAFAGNLAGNNPSSMSSIAGSPGQSQTPPMPGETLTSSGWYAPPGANNQPPPVQSNPTGMRGYFG